MSQMDALENCPECDKLFTRTSRPICSECWAEQEFEIRLVQQWMKQNTGFSLTEAGEATDVEVDRISAYIQQGRIKIEKSMGVELFHCQSCGATIVTGSLCRGCLAKLTEGGGQPSHGSSSPPPQSEHLNHTEDEGRSQIRKFRRE